MRTAGCCCFLPETADRVEEAWAAVGAGVKADTIVVLTVTDGVDEEIY